MGLDVPDDRRAAIEIEGPKDEVGNVFDPVKGGERRPGDESAALVALAVVVRALRFLLHYADDQEGHAIDENGPAHGLFFFKKVLGQDVADQADPFAAGHVFGVEESPPRGDGVAHPLEAGIDPADRVAEILAAVADETAADEFRADDLDPRDFFRDGFDHLRRDPNGFALQETLPRQRRAGRKHQDDALAHPVEAFHLGLGHRIAEGDQQDDGKRSPDDAGKGQGRAQRLSDEVPQQVAPEDADHEVT